MKFLLNMNVPRKLGRLMEADGHKCRHVGEIAMERASDQSILAEAKQSGECVLTHDLDYGRLMAFSGESSPSVVIFRLRQTDADILFRQITSNWPEISEPLQLGAVVLLEEAATRIRGLPLSPNA